MLQVVEVEEQLVPQQTYLDLEALAAVDLAEMIHIMLLKMHFQIQGVVLVLLQEQPKGEEQISRLILYNIHEQMLVHGHQ